MENISITNELKSHFLRLYQIALCDDNFNHLELALLYKFAQERGISKKELDNILINYSGQVMVPESIEKKMEFLYDFAQMIWADQLVSLDEENALKKYIRSFGFKHEYTDQLAETLIDYAKQGISKQELLNQLQ